ncbi:MAG: DciA family protein [Planctomycetota bacterium]|jgi:hypothetical protein
MVRRSRPHRKQPYREPLPLDEIIPGLMRQLRPKKADPLTAVRAVWPELVGEATAKRSRLASLKDGELTVDVASAALRQHLSVFRREEILGALREIGVERLRCRVSGGL